MCTPSLPCIYSHHTFDTPRQFQPLNAYLLTFLQAPSFLLPLSPLYPFFLPGTILPPPLTLSSLPSPLFPLCPSYLPPFSPLSSLPSPHYPLSSLCRWCEWVRWGREGFHIDKQTGESNPPDCLHYQPNKTTLSQLPSSSCTPPSPPSPRPNTGSSWNSRAMREEARVSDMFTSMEQEKVKKSMLFAVTGIFPLPTYRLPRHLDNQKTTSLASLSIISLCVTGRGLSFVN